MSLNRWIPPLNWKQWLALAIINMILSAITTLFVVQALTATPKSPTGTTALPNASPAAATRPISNAAPVPTSPPAATKPAAAAVPPATTPAPAATTGDARIKISLSSLGQLQLERIVISNEGDNIDLKDWKISTPRGVSYKFKNVVVFKDSFVNLNSTAGADSSTDLYMGRADAAWKSGDIITLEANDGRKIAIFEVK